MNDYERRTYSVIDTKSGREFTVKRLVRNAQGGTGAQGYNIWGDSDGSVGYGGSFDDNVSVVGDRGYANSTTASGYGGGGGGGSGANRYGGPSHINGAPGQQGSVVIWW
jgi:hypothetical protein